MVTFLKRNGRILLLAGAVLVFCGALTSLFTAQEPLPAANWGLSFQEEGAPPVGNASTAILAKYDAAYVGDGTAQRIYLTFDAGYESGCTGQILDVLRAHDAPAAFFLVGNYLETEPDLVQRMVDEGHIVGNHTDHHYDMSRISELDTFRAELAGVEQRFEALTGQELPKFYRPPQGVYSEENLKMAKKLGYKTVFWSLAYRDWVQDDQPTKEQAFAKLLPRVHPGAVVLLHSTSPTNAAILDELLTRWEDMGYSFGSLDELF